MKPSDIHRFFEQLNRRLQLPVQIILTGGAAAILQGTSRATYDIDFEVRPRVRRDWEAIQKAIEETSNATGIAAQYGEDIDQWSAIAFPSKASRLYRRFGKLELRILKPEVWAIGKLARYLSSDVQDLRLVLKTAKTRPRVTVKLWGTALGTSPASNSQSTFRKQVENFIDQYGEEVWGSTPTSIQLKELFLETARLSRQRHTNKKK